MNKNLYDNDYLEQIKTIQTIVNQYIKIVNTLNNYFIFEKKQKRSEYLTDNNERYPRLQLSYPTNLERVKVLLLKLPQYHADDINATIISLQTHLTAMQTTIDSLFHTYYILWRIKKQVTTQKEQLQQDLQQYKKQYQNLNEQLGEDIKQIQKQNPEEIIFAYATNDLDQSTSLNNQELQQLRMLINDNHRTIQQTNAVIAKAQQINKLLKAKEKQNNGKTS